MQNNYDFQRNEEVDLQEEALAIVAFVESLELLTGNYKLFCEALPKEHKTEAETYLAKLKAMVSALNGGDINLKKALDSQQPFFDKYPSKIKRLGIAGDIVKCYQEQAMTYKAIAERFGLSETIIINFFKAYNSAGAVEKHKIAKNNVYDIERNMQMLHAMLLRQLAKFEADGEISSKFISEYRQLLAMADKQLKEWTSHKKMDELGRIMAETFARYITNDKDREAVLNEFRTLGIKGIPTAIPAKNTALLA